ncbi:uncharacterized protein RCC_09783 [Ramularia collo-cygni]|uniref:SnoaL-like domain-containing protein n=1 Tax=Ramularia collo-cygni TaxID=112498 RepID=A0A2D3V3V5_9PEZI|nr:uncharacterized protein RCC_09783 [Ramularia collo-cygni]CZT24066.1 uncharacterized protein RCC_09783 [Ramularia collo-cygni]
MPCQICHAEADYEIYQTKDTKDLPSKSSIDGDASAIASATWPQIGEHLVVLTRDFFQAVNNRVLSSASPPWTATRRFHAIPEIVNNDGQSEYDLEGHLEALRVMCQMHPEMHVDLRDMVVQVSKKTRCGEVFVLQHTSGLEPLIDGNPSVGRESMGLMEFHYDHLKGGKWLLTRFRSMGGLSMTDM